MTNKTFSRPVAVLFDLDGTLVDSIQLILEAAQHAFEGRPGRRPTNEDWIAGIGTPLRKQLREFVSSDNEVEELNDKYRTYQRREHDRLTNAYPGTLETLAALAAAGHPMGLVTSKSNEMMHRALEHTAIARFMATAIGADSCSIHKPDPFPVRMALGELGYEPHEALFVGDSPHDIYSGNAAGTSTAAALWGPFRRDQIEPANPTFWLNSIRELPALVERIQTGSAV